MKTVKNFLKKCDRFFITDKAYNRAGCYKRAIISVIDKMDSVEIADLLDQIEKLTKKKK